jgi:protein-tyrosine phosphatase
MLDLHCHILPGFPGGPVDMEAALQLVLSASSRGVAAIVATPHFLESDFRPQVQQAVSTCAALISRLRVRGSLIDIQVSGEYRLGQRLARAIVMDQTPALGLHEGRRVLVTQLPEARIPRNIVSVIEWMATQKICPLIACPEQHRDVLRDLQVLEPVVAAGALLEVNAGTLAGRRGPYAQRRSRELLERGWATVMSSNAHAGDAAGALLEVGREAAAAIIGESAAWDLVWKRPAQIAAPHLLGRSKA